METLNGSARFLADRVCHCEHCDRRGTFQHRDRRLAALGCAVNCGCEHGIHLRAGLTKKRRPAEQQLLSGDHRLNPATRKSLKRLRKRDGQPAFFGRLHDALRDRVLGFAFDRGSER